MNNGKVIDFIAPFTEHKYNQFFNPNVCHVCKRPSGDLITCNLCNIIFYCSKEHKEMHINSHKEICIAMARVTTEKSFSNTYSSLEQWVASRDDILERILPSMSRDVYQYEKEMILCAKSCYVCYRQINISPCDTCYSANFCDNHQLEFINIHQKDCDELLLLLNMNIADISYDIEKFLLYKRRKFTKFPIQANFHDTITFINGYVLNNNKLICRKMMEAPNSTLTWAKEQYVYSEAVSDPLTLYYALGESNLLSLLLSVPLKERKYIVHLIDANNINEISWKIWHIFLHYFVRTIKDLYIVYIKSPTYKSHDLGSVCSTCQEKHLKIYVKNVPETYYTYVRSESYEPPNVIILQTRTISKGTWLGSVTAIIAQKCPLLLTADTKKTAQENINIIEDITGVTRKCLYKENKFRGCRPYKNYVTGRCYYRNAHFIMYS
ncbi:uncharacterized protein LOC116850756 [Odontomachus brunneus]|uniref:uncharacterized protein LOC116850756 n=1 Tax=Odontomachus brunneus TaxID=486640 RepID=UPI0013F258B3|nr:uncharacterized protein LOC116850756 [Odontomachus brunneus]